MEAHWRKRLIELEQMEQLHQAESDFYLEHDHEDYNNNNNSTEDVWESIDDSEYQGYNIVKPSEDTHCEMISCVSSSSSRDVACLDTRQLNMSAGAFSATMKTVPLESKMWCGIIWLFD